ncbi:sigma-E factor negative regulatory protein [Modicisalibacter sp. 'Wilcox']|uniref:sigma-E factor negative regulatory protein n=1 Tax=Modicisalibacter sp. 'Wilcox' TaxID=2679914 RepID=UPI0013D5035A|nr:sigma-E factor negative regulatory protein [Modicisalibacter sp. 'Wilcox']
MNDNLRESLSALMDNEGDELELRRVLKSLGDADESAGDSAEVWRRYHLARSLMNRDRDVDVTTDLSAGILARIEREPRPEMHDAGLSRRHGGLSFAGSAAIAATVSLMVITGVQVYNGMDPATAPAMTADSGASTTVSSGSGVSGSPSGGVETVSLPHYSSLVTDGGGNGLMTVGANVETPMFLAPNASQSPSLDFEQAQLLQGYLDRHAQGAAYRSGETWMPLLRASAQDSLGVR